MTRLTALRALLEQPDPEDLPRRGHRKIYAEYDKWKLSQSWVFRVLRSVEKRRTA